MIFGPQKPVVDLNIGGAPAGLVLGLGLKEFTYRDVHHGEVDEIGFTVADPKGFWRGPWGVDEGTEVSGTMGYAGLLGAKIPIGLYTVAEPEASGDSGGDIAKFTAQAASTSKGLRTKRSEGHDKRSLKDIVGKVAGRNGLEVVGDIPDLKFKHVQQGKETDLTFLQRLADKWGFYFSVKGKQLVFTSRESVEEAPPVRTFDLVAGAGIKRWNARRSTTNLYSKAEARYLDPKKNETVEAEVSDDRVKSGDTLKIDGRAESQAHAERLAKARLARENDELGTGKITTVGDPFLLAGQVILLGATFGRYAGRWLVTAAFHKFTSSGYTTAIDIKVL